MLKTSVHAVLIAALLVPALPASAEPINVRGFSTQNYSENSKFVQRAKRYGAIHGRQQIFISDEEDKKLTYNLMVFSNPADRKRFARDLVANYLNDGGVELSRKSGVFFLRTNDSRFVLFISYPFKGYSLLGIVVGDDRQVIVDFIKNAISESELEDIDL